MKKRLRIYTVYTNKHMATFDFRSFSSESSQRPRPYANLTDELVVRWDLSCTVNPQKPEAVDEMLKVDPIESSQLCIYDSRISHVRVLKIC